MGFSGASNISRASAKVGPLYQGIFSDFLTRLSPFQPDTGMKFTFDVLYPTSFNIFQQFPLPPCSELRHNPHRPFCLKQPQFVPRLTFWLKTRVLSLGLLDLWLLRFLLV